MAVAGETAASMAEAASGSWNVKASISQLMSTSSGSRVLRDGTMATSSNAYARLAAFPIPISISTRPSLLARLGEAVQIQRSARPGEGQAPHENHAPRYQGYG